MSSLRKKVMFQVFLLVCILWIIPLETAVARQPDLPVVRAVLFMSPACNHCHYVINELLVGMVEEYGDQL